MIPRSALSIDLGDLDRLRRAVTQARAVGGDLTWLGEKLAERLESLPARRLAARDEALADLCKLGTGSDRQRAREAASKLARYGATRWRRERALSDAPLIYGTEGAALFAVMKNSPASGAPKERTIRNALAKVRDVGRTFDVSVAHNQRHGFAETTKSAGRKLLDKAKLNSEIEALAVLARAPSTQKLMAEERASTVAKRRELLNRLRALDNRAGEQWLKAEKLRASAIAKVRAAEQALKDANKELASVNGSIYGDQLAVTTQRQEIEAELIAGADLEAIASYRTELYDESARLRRNGQIQTTETIHRDEVKRTTTRNVYSNISSVNRRLAAILTAFAKVDELKLEPDQSKIAERFAEIRAAFPPIETAPILSEKVA